MQANKVHHVDDLTSLNKEKSLKIIQARYGWRNTIWDVYTNKVHHVDDLKLNEFKNKIISDPDLNNKLNNAARNTNDINEID